MKDRIARLHLRLLRWVYAQLDGFIRHSPQCAHLSGAASGLFAKWAAVERELATSRKEHALALDRAQVAVFKLQVDLDNSAVVIAALRREIAGMKKPKKKPARKK